MRDKDSIAKDFKELESEDKDLIMFTITDLKLEQKKEQVHMVISLKRKIQTELLTTYLPTLLLLIITYATTFFKSIYFEASLTVNLTIMLVMTTIFTSKIEELPPTSDTKMIDIWLIFCLLVPFSFTLVQTAIECYREEDDEEQPDETWAKARKDEKVVFKNRFSLKNHFVQYYDDQEKDLTKGRTETKVAVAQEEEATKAIPVGTHNFQKVKVQRSSFDMLQKLQWTGWPRTTEFGFCRL